MGPKSSHFCSSCSSSCSSETRAMHSISRPLLLKQIDHALLTTGTGLGPQNKHASLPCIKAAVCALRV